MFFSFVVGIVVCVKDEELSGLLFRFVKRYEWNAQLFRDFGGL